MNDALLFAAIAALATLLTFALALRPMWRARPRSGWLLIIGLTLASAGLYRLVGSPMALDATMVQRPDTIEEALSQLERSSDNFPDHEGWVMLATTYTRVGQTTKARDAWEKVLTIVPDDANFLTAAAEARAQAHPQRRFDARALELLERAVKGNPQHQRARLFLGVALRQQDRPADAVKAWEPLLALVDNANADALRAEIEAARKAAGLPPLPPASVPPASTTTATAAVNALTVKVTLDPSFASRVRLRGDATVFVIARAPDGPPMPVAVQKHTLADLPLTITLDDSDGPMPTAKLSWLQDVEVIARISASGNAIRQDGDIESKPVRVRLPAAQPVELVLGAE